MGTPGRQEKCSGVFKTGRAKQLGNGGVEEGVRAVGVHDDVEAELNTKNMTCVTVERSRNGSLHF